MYICSALVTSLALLVYQVTAFNVGSARGKYGIKAPATTGNEQFERIYRVQMNTLEQLAFFLPALWLFAINMRDEYAALIGLVWIAGRILYARGYYQDAAKRSTGFMISFFAAVILLLGGVIGALVRG